MSAVTTAERHEIVEVAAELAAGELAPRAAALDEGDRAAFDECWLLLAELGLDRALIAEHAGGAGLAADDLLAIVEELAVGEGGVAMAVLLCNAALAALEDEQLARVPAGQRWAAVVAPADGGGRICALGADRADGLLLVSREPGVVAAVLPADLARERDEAQLGLRGAPAAVLRLDAAVAASSARAGAPTLALLRSGTAAVARGIARRAHAMALAYARERRQGGVAIFEHEAVRDMLAAMLVRLECTRTPALPESSQAALAAKVAATDAAVATTTDAVQVFGGTGYMVETGAEKLMRDAKYCQLFPEANWEAQAELMR